MNHNTIYVIQNSGTNQANKSLVIFNLLLFKKLALNLMSVAHRLRFLAFILLVILFSAMFSIGSWQFDSITSANASASSNVSRSESEVYYLSATNAIRQKNKLKPLIIDSRLSRSAAIKATDMTSQKYWGHYSTSGVSFADYIWNGSPKADKVGENLAKCYINRQQAFAALVASTTHYQVMTGSFTNMGVAEVTNTADGCTYTVFHFAEYK